MLFRDELHDLAARHPAFELHEQLTRRSGRLSALDVMARVCPDWRERETWACGPNTLLDEVAAAWADADRSAALHLERFAAAFVGVGRQGGTVRFAASGVSVTVDGATTLMQAGEQAGIPMPFGCRMGICHTCVVPLTAGSVRDLRTGTDQHGAHLKIQTCVTAAAGDCTLDL